MHQTKKGNQWYFGMKAHIGVDSKTKLIHSIVATAANEHDKHALPQLLHGNERRVYGDSAYSSQKTLIAQAAPKARVCKDCEKECRKFEKEHVQCKQAADSCDACFKECKKLTG